MKAFQFKKENEIHGVAAETEQLAVNYYTEEINDLYEEVEEIPESEWGIKNIKEWEDNDMRNEPIMVSIREIIIGNETQLIFSNVIDF